MKKSILIFCTVLISFGLIAFAFKNRDEILSGQKESVQSDSELFYKVGSRYKHTITKEALHKATSVTDIVPQSVESQWSLTFQTVTVAVLQNGDERFANGEDKQFNVDQIKLLRSADYSTDFYIKTRTKSNYADRRGDNVYYFTVVPEKEAEYLNGHEALMTYLKENSKEYTAHIKEDKLRPARVNFTITKNGTIANSKLNATSGDAALDVALVELVNKIPGKWKPAENAKGEKIEQEFVFFFGVEGC